MFYRGILTPFVVPMLYPYKEKSPYIVNIQAVKFVTSDPAGARTQDPMLKRHMLYQLSYGIFFDFEGAKLLLFLIYTNTFLKLF